MTDYRGSYVRDYLKDMTGVLEASGEQLSDRIPGIVEMLLRVREEGKTVFAMGNGGSAATASHFVNDLQKLTIQAGGKRLKVLALTDNVPTMLAWANDSGYDVIFEEQLKNLMQPGDVVVGFSGSGNSPNVLRAFEYANAHGGHTVGFLGYGGGKAATVARVSVVVPSYNMQRCEDVHHMLMHLLCSMIRDELAGKRRYPADLRGKST